MTKWFTVSVLAIGLGACGAEERGYLDMSTIHPADAGGGTDKAPAVGLAKRQDAGVDSAKSLPAGHEADAAKRADASVPEAAAVDATGGKDAAADLVPDVSPEPVEPTAPDAQIEERDTGDVADVPFDARLDAPLDVATQDARPDVSDAAPPLPEAAPPPSPPAPPPSPVELPLGCRSGERYTLYDTDRYQLWYVTDNKTGISWEIMQHLATWRDAMAYCKTRGMRLGTVAELLAIGGPANYAGCAWRDWDWSRDPDQQYRWAASWSSELIQAPGEPDMAMFVVPKREVADPVAANDYPHDFRCIYREP